MCHENIDAVHMLYPYEIHLTHFVAGNNIAVDLLHHCKETKKAVEAVQRRLLLDFPGVQLQKGKIYVAHTHNFGQEHKLLKQFTSML